MAKAINKDKKYILLNLEKLKDQNLMTFKKLIKERSYRKPVAYLINKKSFWNSEFFVNKHALIPRPDTELLIESTLNFVKITIASIRYWNWIWMHFIVNIKRKNFMVQELTLVKIL